VFPPILLADVVVYHGMRRPVWLWLQARRAIDDRAPRVDAT
jgi:hypothetical protein